MANISFLSKHPFDWIIHLILCFVPVYFGWAVWFVVAFVGILIEYEQKYSWWCKNIPWKDYILYKALGDLIFQWRI